MTDRPPADDRLLKVAEAASRLNVSSKTIRKYIDAGLLPAVRLPSRQFRIKESDLKQVTTAP